MPVDKVTVIGGTGNEGFGLALRWAAAGIGVVIGSRDSTRATEAAARLTERLPDANVEGLENPEAAAAAQVVVVTVPFAGQAVIYKSIAASITDQSVVIDCTVPLAAAVGARPTHTLGVWEGSAALQGWSYLDGGQMCSAFHSLAASELDNLERPIEGDVLVCGTKRNAKHVVRELIEAIPNLRYVDAGPLENARYVEPITALLMGINKRYGVHGAGIRITGLPE
jgi:NADPH-dependent F420 reductase